MIRFSAFITAVIISMCYALPILKLRKTSSPSLVRTTAETIEPCNSFIDMFEDSIDEVSPPLFKPAEGEIPPYVSGTMIRNGPSVFGTLDIPNIHRRYDHIFDGLARLTRYEMRPQGMNGINFSAKFLRSFWWEKMVSNKGDIPPSITTGPVYPSFDTFQLIEAGLTSASRFDNVPVNIAQIGGEGGLWVGVTDAPVLLSFDENTLDTKGRADPVNSITTLGGIELFSTAHPTNKGNFTYNYFLELRPIALPGLPNGNLAHIVRTSADMTRQVVGTINVGEGYVPYVHDFSLTGKYAILCIWPLRMDMANSMNGKGFLPQLEWEGDKGANTKIFVFDIENAEKMQDIGPIVKFEAPPMFAYHHVNAYTERSDSETGVDTVVIDITGYQSPGIINGAHGFAYISNMRDPEKRKKQERDGQLFRYRLPISTRRSQQRHQQNAFITPTLMPIMDKRGYFYGGEMVRVDDGKKGMKCRFSYAFTGFSGTDSLRGGFMRWALVKRDHEKAESLAQNLCDRGVDWRPLILSGQLDCTMDPEVAASASAIIWEDDDCYPTEPIFVKDPSDGSSEDQGVLLSQVYDGRRRETFLLVLDAVTMTELARCYTGIRCPVSFHGQYLKKAAAFHPAA